jgi:putative ABC transport system substrate-binding protein
VQDYTDPLVVTSDPLFIDRRLQIVTLASRHGVPTIYPFRQFTEVGGLMMYGPNLAERDRHVGLYTAAPSRARSPPTSPSCQSRRRPLSTP